MQVRGKVNAITMDKCSRTGLLFDQGKPPAAGHGAYALLRMFSYTVHSCCACFHELFAHAASTSPLCLCSGRLHLHMR